MAKELKKSGKQYMNKIRSSTNNRNYKKKNSGAEKYNI